MKRFLIINPFGIGDVLFTTPLIQAIKSEYPDSYIAYWCNERVKEVFKNNPRVSKVFALSRGDLKKIYKKSPLEGIKRFAGLIFGLRKEKFEIVFDFTLDHRYGLVSKLLGIKQRIGYNYKNRGRFLTHKIDISGYANRHVVDYYLDLLKFVGIEPKKRNLELFVPERDNIKSRILFESIGIKQDDLVVGLAPGAGASWGQSAALKHWPSVKFSRLADKLINNLGAKVIILGDLSERSLADTVLYSMSNKAIDLVGKTGLEELFAVINNLQVLVANDGGMLHIAVALGKKTVSMFGPVDEAVYGPYPLSPKHAVIKKDLSCRPCYKKFRMGTCLMDRQCMNSIEVDEVFAEVSRLLLNKGNN